jgi:tetratricopeptide (TPR) repeat protein
VRRLNKGVIAGAAFSPDSRLLAIGDVFGVIRLVETVTGREVARLTGPEPLWYSPACFTPDGTRLIACCSGTTALYVWDLRLIRRQLKDLDLDWDWPAFPPATADRLAGKPRRVEVLLGELGISALGRAEKARQDIERYRSLVKARPKNALACNNLAWAYITAPAPLRDVKAALPLAEKAVRLEPKNPICRNTLGVAYYRAGRYRQAVEVLRANLNSQEDWGLAYDLYFLAMSYQQLGEAAHARDYYTWAIRWVQTQRTLSADQLQELAVFRTEAEEQLGVKKRQ